MTRFYFYIIFDLKLIKAYCNLQLDYSISNTLFKNISKYII